MISEADKTRILEIGRRFGVSRILLFGSSVHGQDAGDIDLGVSGVPTSRFFEFYGELIFSLSKPVDVVDLEKKSAFTELIQSEGVRLYG